MAIQHFYTPKNVYTQPKQISGYAPGSILQAWLTTHDSLAGLILNYYASKSFFVTEVQAMFVKPVLRHFGYACLQLIFRKTNLFPGKP